MPSFETPGPIAATIDVVSADVRISAGERQATVVDVRPADAADKEDVKAAERTSVEYADGELVIRAPKLRSWLPHTEGGSIAVTVELPAGSHVHGSGGLADFRADGPLGDCRIKTGLGRIELQEAGALELKSGAGDISVERATGHAEVRSGSGDIRLRRLDGSAVIKSSNGATWVGEAHGELRLRGANGEIAVGVSHAGVVAKTANGDIRLGEAARGTVVLETGMGDVEVGIPEGVAAWLDVSARAGRVANALPPAAAPADRDGTVEVRARTSLGDITVRRP